MNFFKNYIIIPTILLSAHLVLGQQVHLNHIAPQGGGSSIGGTYTNFSTIGNDIVSQSLSGGSYSGSAGFLISSKVSIVQVSVQDSLALVALYDSTNGDGWTNNSNWKTGKINTWYGVSINANGRVDSLHLTQNNLVGVIPPAIGDLTDLKSLRLNSNLLNGTIPPEIGNLVNLNFLDLSRNLLEGELPAEFSNLIALNILDIWVNQLSGPVPVELFDLPNVYSVAVNNNNFTEFPDISNTSSILENRLGYLDVRNNFFTFEDLQPFTKFDSVDQVLFNIQKNVGPGIDTAVSLGSDLALYFNVGGTGNIYQWMKGEDSLANAVSDTLMLSDIATAHHGLYHLIITNPEVPGLTLRSEMSYVEVEGFNNFVNGPDWEMAYSFGDGSQRSQAGAVEIDRYDNVLLYGQLNGSFDFFGESITAADSGIFIAKFNSELNLQSLIKIPGTQALSQIGDFMVHDKPSGNTYIAGKVLNSLTVDTFQYNSSAPSEWSHFVMSIAESGTVNWIKEYPIGVEVYDLSVHDNQLIASALYKQPVTIEGHNLPHEGEFDIFFVKYDSDGNSLFVNSVTGASQEYLAITDIDSYGHIYLATEATSGIINYSDGSSLALAEGAGNVLVVKYDGAGNKIWENTYSGSTLQNGDYYSWPSALTVDPHDNIVVAGWMGRENIFGSDTLRSPFAYNKYIAQISSDGNVNWSNIILEEREGFDYNEIETDHEGNIYYMVQKASDIYIDGIQFPLSGINDHYVVKYTSQGQAEWVKEISASKRISILQGMGVVDEDIVFVGGRIADTQVTFDDITIGSVNNETLNGFIAGIGFREASSDSLALVAFYNATGGPDWTNNTNWLTGPISSWYGIEFVNNAVRSIDLDSNNLVGTVPHDIKHLQNLASLSLEDNGLTAVSDSLSLLLNLSVIELAGNSLTELPEGLHNNNIAHLAVEDNNLDFIDLNRFAHLPSFNYAPQGLVGKYEEVFVNLDDPFVLSAVGGTDTSNYIWYKESQEIIGQTSEVLEIPSIGDADEGTYYYEVTDGALPMLTLLGSGTTLIISTLESDSAALVALYNATNGDEWAVNTNWLQTNLSDNNWAGVTIVDHRVVGVDLANNNLTGVVPAEINNFTSLDTLDLSNNNISGLPEIKPANAASFFDVSENRLQFGSLENNASIPGLNYENQALIGEASYTEIPVGSNSSVGISTTGTANTYQWYLNGEAIESATSDNYTINNIDINTMGEYHVEVKNDHVPDLTLTSQVQEVLATASIEGTISLSNNDPLDNGEVMLLRVSSNGFDTTNVQAVNTDGTYLIESVVLDKYLFIARADTIAYPDEFPTYYSRSIFWEEADTILIEGNLSDLSIQLEAIPEVTLEGEGSIQGLVEETYEDTAGKLTPTRRVAGATVTIRRRGNANRIDGFSGSRMMNDYDLIVMTYTDDLGNFTFDQLEPGEYRVNIQYPGYPMDTTSNIDITIGEKRTEKDRTLKAEVKEGKIIVEVEEITAIEHDEFTMGITAYPNPAKDYLNVSFANEGREAGFNLFDSKGASVEVNNWTEGNVRVFDTSMLTPGMYYLNIYDVKENILLTTFKIIIHK